MNKDSAHTRLLKAFREHESQLRGYLLQGERSVAPVSLCDVDPPKETRDAWLPEADVQHDLADDFATARGSYGPWGRANILHETISVLTQYTVRLAKFPVRGPAVGWVMTSVFDKEDTLVAECLLNQAMVKESYERYAEEAAALHRLLTK